jgi:regulator of replication initiation timing
MDDAGKYTAEHNVMEANLKIASLESRITDIIKENKQLIEENKRLRKELEQPKLNGKEVSKGLTL